ncbi:hypothetical protein LPJ75_000260 [Coemansia sp. RSA 2598]|nr:hypothetical protein LPJ75_000260 [Coemansia sp. RSA 2598]
MNKVNVCFNEYRELLVVICSTVFVVVTQVVLRWVPGIGDSGFAYNTMTSMTDILIGQISFFVLVCKPAYHCLVDRDEYLHVFLRTLRREDRQSEYELANGEKIGRISSSSYAPASRFDEDLSVSSRSLAKILRTDEPGTIQMDSVTAFHDDTAMDPANTRMLV